MTDYAKYDFEVIRTRTTQHRGLVTVVARNQQEADLMAIIAAPKHWKVASDRTKMTRKMREKENGQ